VKRWRRSGCPSRAVDVADLKVGTTYARCRTCLS